MFSTREIKSLPQGKDVQEHYHLLQTPGPSLLAPSCAAASLTSLGCHQLQYEQTIIQHPGAGRGGEGRGGDEGED